MAPAYKTILDAKEKREKGLKLRLASAEQRIQKCQTTRSRALRAYRETLDEFGADADAGVPKDQMALLSRLRGYRYEIRQYGDKLSSLKRQKREIREELQEVARSRKLLEDHIEQMEEEQREEYERRERKAAENYAVHNYSLERGER